MIDDEVDDETAGRERVKHDALFLAGAAVVALSLIVAAWLLPRFLP